MDATQATADEIEANFAQLDAPTLTALIQRANREYWEQNAATLPDPLYDRLVERLRSLDPSAPVLDELGERLPDGPVLAAAQAQEIPPAQRLGHAVRHLRPMLSLDKCYTGEDLLSWATKFEGEVMVMPKMDGVACSLRYGPDGALKIAATRGSGTEGEDITINVMEIEGIPNQLPQALEVEIRGELFMRLSVFRSRFAKEFSNPRNLTAGAIKHKDRGRTRNYTLSFYAYDIDGLDFVDERQKLALLSDLGFDCDHVSFADRDDLVARFEDIAKVRPDLDYEIDGVVYRTSLAAEQQRLGSTGHHPRWSIAYKFQGDTGQTTLKEVTWSVSRTGTITPVALFEPIELSGAMIGRASLHNLNRFEELGLSEGAKIEVTRRGGVIPMVERVVEAGPDNQAIPLPTQCPACSDGVERRKKRDGEFLQCSEPKRCVLARLGELEHFAKVIDIQGFGPKIIAQAADAELLATPADYYKLRVEDLEQLERLGRKSAQNLIDQIEAHRDLELGVFLQALGIEHLGRQNAQLIARNFTEIEKIRALTRDDLMEIKGIKEAIADAIVHGLGDRAELIDALLKELTLRAPEALPEIPTGGPLEGKSFLFTGTLEKMGRKEAQEKVTSNGGEAAKSVTKQLDYLVVGQGKGGASSKQKKAEKLVEDGAELQIITEDEFLAMIES